jgi:hypothetical protein
MRWLGWGVALLWGAVGCGGADEVPAHDGPEPPKQPAEGAFTVDYIGRRPEHPLSYCDAEGAHTATAGDVSADELRSFVTDGIDGADVSCQVLPTAEGFVISADVTQAGYHLGVDVELRSDDFRMRAAQGRVYYESPDINHPVTADDCSFTLGRVDDVASGRAWLRFACTTLGKYQNAHRFS